MAHKKIERKKELDRSSQASRPSASRPAFTKLGCCQEQQVSLAIFLGAGAPGTKAADAPRRFRCFSFVRIPGNRQVFRLFCQ